MAGPLGFVPDDGYSERVWINASTCVYPRVEFEFRPMIQPELVNYDKHAAKLTGMALRSFVAGLIAAKIKTWDLKDAAGAVLPITEETCLKLKDPLFHRLFGVVSNQQGADGFVEQDAQEAEASAKDFVESVRTGRPVAEIAEARQKKT